MAVTGRPFVLALRPLGLGDFLTGVPALRALRRAYPDHRIVLAAPAGLAPLARLCGAVDELHPATPLVPLDAAVEGADIAVDLHGRGPESHRVLLRSQPRRLLAFANPDVPESSGMPAWCEDEHEVLRWCRLLEETGISADPTRLELDPPAGAAPEPGATVIHPGAASPARRWPPERFAAVARAEREAGRRVVVTGSVQEVELAAEVARLADLSPRDVYAGKTSLLELAALLAGAGRVVSGDTGAAHLATAFGTPSVTIFGPTSPAHWGPPQRRRHRVLWAGVHGDPHGTTAHPGLLLIDVADVLNELAELDRLPRAA